MGISANANADTCADQGALWPFTGVEEDHACALSKAHFNIEGVADYGSNYNLASLFGDNSVIGRSISLFSTESRDSAVQACCVITEMDEAAFRAAIADLEDEGEADDNDEESEDSEESESDDDDE